MFTDNDFDNGMVVALTLIYPIGKSDVMKGRVTNRSRFYMTVVTHTGKFFVPYPLIKAMGTI